MPEVAPKIVVDNNIHFGKPIIAGTRIPVDLVMGKLAGGMEVQEVMQEYDLTRQQIMAAFKYAAYIISEESLVYA